MVVLLCLVLPDLNQFIFLSSTTVVTGNTDFWCVHLAWFSGSFSLWYSTISLVEWYVIAFISHSDVSPLHLSVG